MQEQTYDTTQPENNAAQPINEQLSVQTPNQGRIDELIRKRVYAAVGVGFVPIPLVDLAALTAVQVEMIHALCKEYGIPFKAQSAKSIISALIGSATTVAVAPLLSSVAKFIPVIGFTTAVAAASITGAATTYALGQVFNRHFSTGGTLETIEAEQVKLYFADKLEEGKTFVTETFKKKNASKTEAEITVQQA